MWKFRVTFGRIRVSGLFSRIVVLTSVKSDVNVSMASIEFDWNSREFWEDSEFLYFFKMTNPTGAYKKVVVKIKSKERMNKNIR